MIAVENLRKDYDGARGLDGFDLQVQEGELFGLVGPNGAGKSTLIKILATLLPASGGGAAVGGHNVAREPAKVRALMGYMPDVPGLYQDMRVREFLEFFADAYRLRSPRRSAAVARALEISGLGKRSEDFVEELSLGLKQRLVLSRTLLHDPKLLLLDEPATGLDPIARIELRELLKRLNREGVTILISSHILSDLEDICSRVALIAEGRNARDADGRSVLELRAAPGTQNLRCEIQILGEARSAVPAVGDFSGARLLEAEGTTLRVEVSGGPEQAAALLRHLVSAGVKVVGFDTGGPALEQRYQQVFGGKS